MDPGTTVGGGLSTIVWLFGEIAFKWVPGAVAEIIGTSPDVATTAAPTAPITAPVTASDVAQYLSSASTPGTYDYLYHQWNIFVALGTVFSVTFASLIIFCFFRMRQIKHHENLQFAAAARPVIAHDVPKTHLRWNRILEQARGDSDQGWRLAILEADIMLNELLDSLGYKGETMGDKMRQVDRANFNTIDLAWEVHRVRNKIAHEGTAHILNAREVRRIIEIYRTIFKEFKIIE